MNVKFAGNKQYPFISYSPTDGIGLGYDTIEEAQTQANSMNILLLQFYDKNLWNHDYWKQKPEPWVAIPFNP